MSVPRVAALVLAGGRGSRLGGAVPKPLVEVGGRPMIAHVLSRIPRSVSPVLLGANDAAAFGAFGLPVVPDRLPGFLGPLASLHAAVAWLGENGADASHLLCLPGDTPFLPDDVAAALSGGAGERPRLARFAGRLQPTVALWPLGVLARLTETVLAEPDLSIMRFAAAAAFEPVDFDPVPGAPGRDPFFNVNTSADLALACDASSKR